MKCIVIIKIPCDELTKEKEDLLKEKYNVKKIGIFNNEVNFKDYIIFAFLSNLFMEMDIKRFLNTLFDEYELILHSFDEWNDPSII